MSKKPSTHPKTLSSPTVSTTGRSAKTSTTGMGARRLTNLGHLLMGVWAVSAAIATVTQNNLAQMLERQTQTVFFELRGPVSPPKNIVILALDEDSLNQGTRIYSTDPQKYADLAPLQTSPPKRTAYAIAIKRLMQAGARSVSLDVVLDALSEPEVDGQLRHILEQYAGRVTLATQYDDSVTREGVQTQLLTPNPIFETNPQSLGFINYPIAPNGRIHTLASEYPKLIAESEESQEIAQKILQQSTEMFSFAEASLQAAQLAYPKPKGQDIFFYGPSGSFTQIPFWHVLDRTNWDIHLKDGTFKDKIVLIGPTAAIYQDFHAAPFSKTLLYPTAMTGVELHANSIATLLDNKSIAVALPGSREQGILVLAAVLAIGYFQGRQKRSLFRLGLAVGAALVWGVISYGLFTYGRVIVPTAVPMGAIALSGITYFLSQSASEYRRKLQLRQTLAQYAGSPIVQEILSQQDDLDFQEILLKREQAVFGKQLAGRYRIIKVLGSGGFGETYIAEDLHRPGNPSCVVKHLRPASNSPKFLNLARELFRREAETLEKLGKHDQIPQLLAYFEEDQEFYLVQELVRGHPLNQELKIGIPLAEARVVSILRELLQILEFVHSQNVIHRDIKPSNIIRRKSDGKVVLIDFGAVKEISNLAEETESTNATIGIGTKGFMPNEQCAGNPRFSSDIYAVGMTGIQALTGMPPSHLKADTRTGEIIWRHRAQNVSQVLSDVLNKMVVYDFTKRYQSATETLQALAEVASASSAIPLPPLEIDVETLLAQEEDAAIHVAASTKPWPETFGSELPPTDSPPIR